MITAAESFRSVRTRNIDLTVLTGPVDADPPWIAAHLTVLHQRAADVRLEIDFDLLAAVRTSDEELVAQRSVDAGRGRPNSAALKSTLNVPNGWPRHCGRNPIRTTCPLSKGTSTAAA